MNPAVQKKAPGLSEDRKRELLLFLSEHDLEINNLELLNLAFTHSSYSNEMKFHADSNERLEFLGDSVLALVTAQYLYSHLANVDEGVLSKIKASVVSEESLAEIAYSFHLERFLLMGKGELAQGGKMKKAVLADAMEAVIAALYLDQGLEKARSYVLSFISSQVEKYLDDRLDFKDYKTKLQEYIQKKRKALPSYKVVNQTGPDHNQEFTVTVTVLGRTFGPAKGRNKKSAEQEAAHIALRELKIISEN